MFITFEKIGDFEMEVKKKKDFGKSKTLLFKPLLDIEIQNIQIILFTKDAIWMFSICMTALMEETFIIKQ